MNREKHVFIWKKLPALAGLSSVLILQGCAPGQLQANYGASPIASDRCLVDRQPLIATEKQYSDEVAKDVATGAALGGVTALLSGGKGAVVVLSMIAGGASGAAIGYAQAAQMKAHDQAELNALVDGDSGMGEQQIGQLTASIRALNMCRSEEAADLKSRFQSGQIPKSQAETEFANLSTAVDQDRSLIAAVLGRTDARVNELVEVRATAAKEPKEAYLGPQLVAYRGAVAAPEAAAQTRMYAVRTAHVRESADEKSNVLTTLHRGVSVMVSEDTSTDSYYAVSVEGQQGFVAKSALSRRAPTYKHETRETPPPAVQDPTVQVADKTQAFYKTNQDAHATADAGDKDIKEQLASVQTVLGGDKPI